MEPIQKALFERGPITPPKKHANERGDLLNYFLRYLNPAFEKIGKPAMSYARLGHMLEKIPTKDLYYLQSVMEEGKRHGIEPSVRFWGEMKGRKRSDTDDKK